MEGQPSFISLLSVAFQIHELKFNKISKGVEVFEKAAFQK